MDKFYSYFAGIISQKKDFETKIFLTIYRNKTIFKGINNGTI